MLIKKICFNVKNFFRRGAYNAQKKASEYEKLSGIEKYKQDWTDRVNIVWYAYTYIPYYKELYDKNNFHPNLLKTEADWDKVPILEKNAIRSNSEKLLFPNIDRRKLIPTTTGGSTGTPLKLYKEKSTHFEVLHWRALKWYNIFPWDNHGIVNRRVPQNTFQTLKNRLLWFPTKRCYLDASNVTEHRIETFINEINQLKIIFLSGYCGSLEQIANYVLKNHLKTPSLKLVWTTTSPLRKEIRKRMEEAFECQVMDQYGCCEMPNIASQKRGEEFLTVNSDYVHVDIIDQNNNLIIQPYIYGDILITDLKTTVFPLIKYRLGDCSAWCNPVFSSEDGFPKLLSVQGRTTDIIYFPDGGFIDGAFLTTICDSYFNVVDSYQIIQNRNFDIIFKVVLKNMSDESIHKIEEICNNLKQKIQNRVKFQYEICKTIPDDRGKRRYVISDIALNK